MITWSQFVAAAPILSAFGKSRLENRIAYLATIRPDGSPRVHPVSPFIAQGRLFVHMEPTSPKRRDLRLDSRYSMHCAVEDNSGGGGEFLIRGRGQEIEDAEIKKQAFEHAKSIGHDPKQRYILIELSVEEAAATIYQDGAAKRERWRTG
jgi:uncharacterized pyridoxamine 5'-phosphate oxidase family protein